MPQTVSVLSRGKKEPVCKYSGIPGSHIKEVKKKLSEQCGIIAKLRHFLPRKLLIQYYESNVRPIVQYGVLVYGCCSYPLLLPIYQLPKKL